MSVSRSNELTGLSGVQGGFAPLDSGLLVPRAYLPQIAGLLHNMNASAAPTVNDDSGDGYGVGSRWLDTASDREYVCLDATVGAAVWRLATLGTSASFTPVLNAVTSNPTLGSGSQVSGRYVVHGGWVFAVVRITFGTSGVNAGSGEYRIPLPVTAGSDASDAPLGFGYLYDSSGSAANLVVPMAVDTSTARLIRDTGFSVTNAAPWTWAASDQIRLSFSYTAA